MRLKKLLWEITQSAVPNIKSRRIKRSVPGPYVKALNSLTEHYRKQKIVSSYYELIDSQNKKWEYGITT